MKLAIKYGKDTLEVEVEPSLTIAALQGMIESSLE
jgi:hypothetical protein